MSNKFRVFHVISTYSLVKSVSLTSNLRVLHSKNQLPVHYSDLTCFWTLSLSLCIHISVSESLPENLTQNQKPGMNQNHYSFFSLIFFFFIISSSEISYDPCTFLWFHVIFMLLQFNSAIPMSVVWCLDWNV